MDYRFVSTLWLIFAQLSARPGHLKLIEATNNGQGEPQYQLVTEIPGYVIIDCGSNEDYFDEKIGIHFKSDTDFVSTGENHMIPPGFFTEDPHVGRAVNNLRSFPEGKRNCYTLKKDEPENCYYYIRAYFRYASYDGKAFAPENHPTFDVYIGVNFWHRVREEPSIEAIHFIPTHTVDFCLVNIGNGVPYVSTLEFMPLLNTSIYQVNQSLSPVIRYDIRPSTHPDNVPVSVDPANAAVWPKDDLYGRFWWSYMDPGWTFNDTSDVNISGMDGLKEIPVQVLKTAAQAANTLTYTYTNGDMRTYNYYFYFHFAEVSKLEQGRRRQVTINLKGDSYGPVTLEYLKPLTLRSNNIFIPNQESVSFSIRSTTGDLPPILNAFEIYQVNPWTSSPTDAADVDGILEIKRVYKVNRVDWQGDPCLPVDFAWNGLNCSDGEDQPPRIISLNLSSSNLSGNIASAFFNLKAIKFLDLSYNKLNGTVPEFLTQLPNLTVINLTGNFFTGSIPRSLIEKLEKGILQLSWDGNPSNCQKQTCEKKKPGFVLPVVLIVSILVLLLLCAIAVFWIKKRKREEVPESETRSPLKSKNWRFTYSAIVSATNNFSTSIGEGGFGKVYLGNLKNGPPVAVKLLSQSSTQGYREFQSEVQLLMVVHHRNLVSLIGYSDDPNTMALVYEYMENGNLRQRLSDRSGTNVLSWKERLQIAVDAAHGLEYLHNGCKPPIIHRDLKTSNILLNQNHLAKISDFGLSRVMTTERDSHINTNPAGTFGYVDPEFYASGNLNKKSDVYSFGVILFEIITGLPAVIKSHESSTHILQWIGPIVESGNITGVVDPKLQGEFNTSSAWKAVEIAMSCVPPTALQRPDMNQVLAELKECLAMELESERPETTTTNQTMFSNSLVMSLPSVR